MKIVVERSENKRTFTKKWLDRFFTMAIFDVQIVIGIAIASIALNYYNGFEINVVEAIVPLAITIVTEIISLSVGYFFKSYHETKQEKEQDLEERRFEASLDERGC